MKKTVAFALSLLAISAPALAQVGVGYRATNGYYYINKLYSGKLYHVDLGGMPLIRNRTSNKCGILEFKPSTNELSNLSKIEIVDPQQTYGFDFTSLAARETPKCSGQVVTDHAVWLSSKGYIGISGLTPVANEKIRFLSSTSYRNLKANQCGFLSFQLDTVVPSAFIVDGLAYPTNGTPGRGIYCKQGILYISYPPPIAINPIDGGTWTKSNPLPPPSFSPGTIVITSSGGGSSGSGTSGGGSSGSGTSGGGTSGGSTSGSGSSGSGNKSGGTSGGGTVAVTPPGGTSGGGTQPQQKPQPPTGQKMCKVGTQLVSIVPKANTKYYSATEEDQSYEEENSDSTGYIVFNNINFTDTSNNGGLSDIEIGEIDLTKPSWANRKPLGGGWTVNISVVKPCS